MEALVLAYLFIVVIAEIEGITDRPRLSDKKWKHLFHEVLSITMITILNERVQLFMGKKTDTDFNVKYFGDTQVFVLTRVVSSCFI